jgi:hypothetical protein
VHVGIKIKNCLPDLGVWHTHPANARFLEPGDHGGMSEQCLHLTFQSQEDESPALASMCLLLRIYVLWKEAKEVQI